MFLLFVVPGLLFWAHLLRLDALIAGRALTLALQLFADAGFVSSRVWGPEAGRSLPSHGVLELVSFRRVVVLDPQCPKRLLGVLPGRDFVVSVSFGPLPDGILLGGPGLDSPVGPLSLSV